MHPLRLVSAILSLIVAFCGSKVSCLGKIGHDKQLVVVPLQCYTASEDVIIDSQFEIVNQHILASSELFLYTIDEE